jgi:hypothetical protein
MKRIAWVLLGLVGALLVANGFMSWRVDREFESRVAAIRKAGDPASIADLKPQPMPDSENAAVHIDRLTPRLEAFSREYGAFYTTPLGRQLEQLNGGPATPEQIEAMRAILDQYTDLEQAIVLASHCPAYGSTMDFSLGFNKFLEVHLDRISRVRTIARMTDWRTQVLLADGMRDEAVQRWLAVLRLARLQQSEPSVVAWLVSFAVRNVALNGIHRAMTDGPIAAANHAEIEAELALADDPRRIERMLRTERAISVSASREHSEGMAGPLDPVIGWVAKRYFVGPFDYYEDVRAAATRPWPQVRQQFMPPAGGRLPPTGHGVLADLLQDSIGAAVRADRRDLANVRALRAINALAMFAAANGREATGLAEAGLPDGATADPFGVGPLVAKHTDAGWLVYSVGDNGVDDGGVFEQVQDVGFGPPAPQDAEDQGDE